MNAQDRNSYLGPPALASLKTANTTSSSPSPDVTPRTTPATTVSAAPSHATPTFGDIPVRNDVTSAHKQHFSPSAHHVMASPHHVDYNSHNQHAQPHQSQQQAHHPSHNSRPSQTSSMKQQSPYLSLEHLSLESDEARDGRGRSPRNYSGEPRSAIEPTSRPHFPRALSSNHQGGLHSATLPTGAAPPPSGPLPPPPQSAGESWRNQFRARENMT